MSHSTLFLLSLHLGFVIGLIHNLFVFYDDSVVGKETFMRTIYFEPLQKKKARRFDIRNHI